MMKLKERNKRYSLLQIQRCSAVSAMLLVGMCLICANRKVFSTGQLDGRQLQNGSIITGRGTALDDLHTLHPSVARNVPKTPGGRNLRVLFLTHKTATFDTFMDRFFVYQYRSAKRHPHVDAHMWGLDFRGYNNSHTLRENLLRRFGSVFFDVVYLFGIARNHELVEISNETAIMIREHECFDRRCVPYLRWNNVSVGMFTYAQEIYQYANESHRRLLVHSPHCSHAPYFYSGTPVDLEAIEARNVSISLQGVTTEPVYPLRARFVRLANAGTLPNVYVRKHPGYWAKDGGPEPDDPNAEDHVLDKQVREYAQVMRRSKICLMDTSRYRYALTKYAEAAAAGCLIVGDIPMERAAEFRQFVVEIRPNDTDQHIASTVQWWLEHDRERAERAAIGQRIMLRKYTWDAWVDDLLIESYNMWRQEQFGLWFPYPFAMTCAASNVIEGKLSNPWCRDSAG